MKPLPIIFQDWGVRAILSGQKTHTRQLSGNYEVGQIRWVKECWRTAEIYDTYCPSKLPGSCGIQYRADECSKGIIIPPMGKWRSSLFMPRWASRINLEVISVERKRLQDMTDEDALMEGVPRYEDSPTDSMWCPRCLGEGVHGWAASDGTGLTEVDCSECDTPLKLFRNIWDHINGKPKRKRTKSGIAYYEFNPWASNPMVTDIGFKVVK